MDLKDVRKDLVALLEVRTSDVQVAQFVTDVRQSVQDRPVSSKISDIRLDRQRLLQVAARIVIVTSEPGHVSEALQGGKHESAVTNCAAE